MGKQEKLEKGDTVTIEFEVIRVNDDENSTIISLAPVGGDEAWLNLPVDQIPGKA